LDHGDRAIFSQCFLGKINLALPFMNCPASTSLSQDQDLESERDSAAGAVRVINVLTTFITALMEKNLRLRQQQGQAHSRNTTDEEDPSKGVVAS
jgi:hypothetical protein